MVGDGEFGSCADRNIIGLVAPSPAVDGFQLSGGRAATGRSTPWPDVLRTLFTRYPQALLTSLPLLLALNLWVAAANLQGSNPPWFVTAGVVANLGVTLVLAVVTLHALTMQVPFDLPVRRFLQYSLVLALTWLLTLGARLAGGATWLLIPALLQPFAVPGWARRGRPLAISIGGGLGQLL